MPAVDIRPLVEKGATTSIDYALPDIEPINTATQQHGIDTVRSGYITVGDTPVSTDCSPDLAVPARASGGHRDMDQPEALAAGDVAADQAADAADGSDNGDNGHIDTPDSADGDGDEPQRIAQVGRLLSNLEFDSFGPESQELQGLEAPAIWGPLSSSGVHIPEEIRDTGVVGRSRGNERRIGNCVIASSSSIVDSELRVRIPAAEALEQNRAWRNPESGPPRRIPVGQLCLMVDALEDPTLDAGKVGSWAVADIDVHHDKTASAEVTVCPKGPTTEVVMSTLARIGLGGNYTFEADHGDGYGSMRFPLLSSGQLQKINDFVEAFPDR